MSKWTDHETARLSLPAQGMFEVRSHPITDPNHMRRCYGRADRGIGGWYVVIEQAHDEPGGLLGAGWYHPDPEIQILCHGTFDQHLTPVDDDARAIVKFVKEQP